MAIHQKVESLNVLLVPRGDEVVITTEHGGDWVYSAEKGHKFIDGVPVIQQVYEFACALRKAMPGVKFGHSSDNRISLGGASEVWVYYPGQEYALGYIGFGDYAINTINNVYAVYSRKVSNPKIRTGKRQHHILQTSDMARAVKNARKVFIPYTMIEIAKQSCEMFGECLRSVVEEAESEVNGYINKCRNADVINRELRNLISLGVQFVTPEFQAAAAQFLTAEAEARSKKAHLQGAYFIRTYERFDGMYADVLTYDRKIKDAHRWTHVAPIETTTIKVDDIPEDVQMKIATLSMMDAETYVPLVGYRSSNSTFWVERGSV